MWYTKGYGVKKKTPKTEMTKEHYKCICIALIVINFIMLFANQVQLSVEMFVVLELIVLIISVIYLINLDNKQIKEYNDRQEDERKLSNAKN